MNKLVVLSFGAMLCLSSCGTYTETGAATGGWFGSIIGSAIGGIAGGPRGSDIGTLVGMAGGAAVGAAVGQAADKAEQQRIEEYRQRRADWAESRREPVYAYPDSRGYEVKTPDVLELRSAVFIDANHDQILTRGEEARVVFEIFNISERPLYRVRPNVTEISRNRHIEVSDDVMIESIAPGKGIRYTALIRADNHLTDGEAVFRLCVFQGNKEIVSQTRDFRISTSKR